MTQQHPTLQERLARLPTDRPVSYWQVGEYWYAGWVIRPGTPYECYLGRDTTGEIAAHRERQQERKGQAQGRPCGHETTQLYCPMCIDYVKLNMRRSA
jgi:hypothetical protein